jgi:hypothetical protein
LEATVIYEGNAQILSGNVFKMWYTFWPAAGGTQINYAESTNGTSWTQYSGNPVLASYTAAKIFKNGSTYYMYANPGGGGDTSIDAYTSSNGTSWSLAKTGTLGTGTSGAWDDAQVYNLRPVYIDGGGTWHAVYCGNRSSGILQTGLATSTDGLNWTKYVSNPVLTNVVSNWVVKVGGTFYTWGDRTLYNSGTNQDPALFPTTAFVKSSSTDLINWTPPVPSLFMTTAWEGLGLPTSPTGKDGQLDSPVLVEANGTTYFFYGGGNDYSTGKVWLIGLATANQSLASIASSSGEGVVGFPVGPGVTLASDNFTRADENPLSNGGKWTTITGIGNLQIVSNVCEANAASPVLASDNFTRANENPLSDGGNWTTVTGWSALQVASNVCEGTANGNCGAYWSGRSWSNDQYSEVTVGSTFGTGGFISPCVRMSGGNGYGYFIQGGLGSPRTVFCDKVVNGSGVALGTATTTVTPQIGDVFRLQVSGTTINFYQNGVLKLSQTDSTYSSGAPGLHVEGGAGGNSNAQCTLWSGGNVTTANCGALWTGTSLPNDQWSEVTIGSNFSSGTFITPVVRGTGNNYYGYFISGGLGASQTVFCDKVVSGVSSSLPTANFTVIPHAGDVFRLEAVGTTLYFYQNGNLLNSQTDTTFSSGSPGLNIQPSGAVSGAQVSYWSAGNNVNVTNYSVPDCRVAPAGPNASRNVQGTSIYDVQTSSNHAIPPVDSRAAGAPVDCRVSPNIPQNSRTPGTYGPGE